MISVLIGAVNISAAGEKGGFDWDKLNAQVAKELREPVRPGIPGKQPFWNQFARYFMYPPAFDFEPVKGATAYRFTVIVSNYRDINKDKAEHTFTADVPWAPITPVWERIPVAGIIARVKVEGLDAKNGKVLGTAQIRGCDSLKMTQNEKKRLQFDGEFRRFRRKPYFKGPDEEPVTEYRKSALRALQFLYREHPYVQPFKKGEKPQDLIYPAKLCAGVITGMSLLSQLSPSDEEAKAALQIAKNAAKTLQEISQPEGTPFEFFPPTYAKGNTIRMKYPAYAGMAYLDLYDATRDASDLKAAIRIAETYKKTQLASGSWYAAVNAGKGKHTTSEMVMPGSIIMFLDRLVKQYGSTVYKKTADKAFRWVLENSVKTFNWAGQFEDHSIPAPYVNPSYLPACFTAFCLLERAGQNPQYDKMAEDVLRFAEDQFITWRKGRTGVSEQYWDMKAYNAGAALMARAYLKAFQVTGKPLFLAKAQSLVVPLVNSQMENGDYPLTFKDRRVNKWINCSVISAESVLQFGRFMKKKGLQ